jgi:hypothetical protein
MLKPDITFERFLTAFVPGAVFVFGSFYLHRPLLLKYFPYVAGYSTTAPADTLGPETKILLISIVAICVGVIFDQLSDAAIVSVVAVEDDASRPRKRIRSAVRGVTRIFSFKPVPDLRKFVFTRYLNSPRRQIFLRMVECWGQSKEAEIEEVGKAAVVHQHILFHLRASSDHYYLLYREMYAPLAAAAALYCSFVALFGMASLAPLSAAYVAQTIRVHTPWVYVFLSGLAYSGAILTAYNLKRRVRHFFSQSMTLALHAFSIQEGSRQDQGEIDATYNTGAAPDVNRATRGRRR